ncbi:MAG TPA: Ig-like domain-containing protein [Gemmatimonadales bacterium]|nr:Ig-like domain-containing protein [Gemmatimonadales bacterium]
MSTPPQRWTIGLARAIAATLSGGAALVSILSYTSSAGIRVPGGLMPPLASRAHSVTIGPSADTAEAIGDTLQLAAVVTDSAGAVLAGVAPIWISGDPSIASVSPSGAVAMRGTGVTVITARVGAAEGRSRIVVRQRPAALELDDTLVRVPEGERVPLTARVLDARGNPIVGADVTWAAPDPAIARIENTDIVGQSPGRTSLVAMAGQLQSVLPVEVVPFPGSITVLGGDGQHGPAGQPLPRPVTAQIVSRGGRPMAGAVATFGSTAHGAQAEPAVDTSDARGMVQTTWRLGDTPGRQQLSIAVDGVGAAPSLGAEADPVPANTRVEVVTGEAAGEAGDTLPEPVLVRVTDSLGRALADLPVGWTALDGGALAAQVARTDSLGEARALWMLGPKAGRQRARVQVGDARTMPPVTAVAAARPGTAASVRLVAGDRQIGSVGQALEASIAVRAVDRHGNPVPDASLRVRPLEGRVAESIVVTDAAGRAKIAWTLGKAAGLQRLAVRLDGDTAEVEVTALARPGKAAGLAFVSPPKSGASGRPLAKPLVVQVTDAYGNPLAGRTVQFKATSGSVTPSRGLTDDDGRTSVRWTLGPKSRRPELTGTVTGTRITGTLTLSAHP